MDDIPLSSLFPSFGSSAILLRFGLVLPLSPLLYNKDKVLLLLGKEQQELLGDLVAAMVQLKSHPCDTQENLAEPSLEVSRFFPADFSSESLHRAFIQGWVRIDAVGAGKAGGVHCHLPVISSLQF